MNIAMSRRSSIAGLLIAGLLLSSRDEAMAPADIKRGSDEELISRWKIQAVPHLA